MIALHTQQLMCGFMVGCNSHGLKRVQAVDVREGLLVEHHLPKCRSSTKCSSSWLPCQAACPKPLRGHSLLIVLGGAPCSPSQEPTCTCRRAVNCLEALLRGAHDRATLNVFPRWHDHGLEANQGGFLNSGAPGEQGPSSQQGCAACRLHFFLLGSMPCLCGL